MINSSSVCGVTVLGQLKTAAGWGDSMLQILTFRQLRYDLVSVGINLDHADILS